MKKISILLIIFYNSFLYSQKETKLYYNRVTIKEINNERTIKSKNIFIINPNNKSGLLMIRNDGTYVFYVPDSAMLRDKTIKGIPYIGAYYKEKNKDDSSFLFIYYYKNPEYGCCMKYSSTIFNFLQ